MTAAGPVTEVILIKIVRTCGACPAQWDAWDLDGNYWYLRYRHSRGTAERQPGPDWTTWDRSEPDIRFSTEDDDTYPDGWIELADFCKLAGLNIHPVAVIDEHDR